LYPPGPHNLITDVDGLSLGNAQDVAARTGVTVVLPDNPATAAVDVRGGAPGTRDTDALDPTCLVEHVDAIVLSGGSAFGLESASGAMTWLNARGRGFAVGETRVPIVPCAILFDLLNGGDKEWATLPYRELAVAACDGAAKQFALGNMGAGLGATAADLKGGLGSASSISPSGIQVGAVVAANPFGPVVMPGSDAFWAWPLEQNGEFGGARPERSPMEPDFEFPEGSPVGANTTVGVVATNASLTVAQLQRVAIMAHDGIARAVRPAHSPFDGDTVFALATGTGSPEGPSQLGEIGMMAADCLARAIARGVYEAETLGNSPSYRSRHGPSAAGG
jgi:L-aminopeptidase/D-esterase-like protein